MTTCLLALLGFAATWAQAADTGAGATVTLDPADGETVQSLGAITISAGGVLMEANWDDFDVSDIVVFDKARNVVAHGADFDYEEDGNEVKTSYTITLDNTIVDEGNYTYQIPAGFFYIGGLDNMSETMSATVYVDGSLAKPGEEVTFTFNPANGATVPALQEIVVGYDGDITCSWNYMGGVTVTDGNGNTVATDASADVYEPDDWSEPLGPVTITLTERVTAAGDYTVTFPAGYFIYGNKNLDSPELSITVTVDGSEAGASATVTLDPADGETLQSLGTITISAGGVLMEANWDDFEVSDIVVFDKARNVVAHGADFDYEEDGNEVKTSYTITLDNTIVDEGYYTYEIPAGFFYIGGLDNMSETMGATVYVDGSLAEPGEEVEYTYDPENGSTVTNIHEITVGHEGGIACSWNYTKDVTVVDSDGKVVANSYDAVNNYPDDDPFGASISVTIIFDTKVVAAGEYTVTIPEGYFNIGAHDVSNTITLTYTVDGSEDVTVGINSAIPDATEDDRYYNLNGQRVTAPKGGIYILNGKKVIVRN